MNRGYAYSERLGRAAAGRTLLDWMSDRYRHSDEQTWRERIERGEVSLDGARPEALQVLRPGQSLVWSRPPWHEPDVPLGFAVLHRDDQLLAVAKPRGLPSLPNGGFLEHTLLHQVRRLFPAAVPMHRLGRGTSGLLLFCLDGPARQHVAREWRAARVAKDYLALVHGYPARDGFTVDVPIGPVAHDRLGSVHAALPSGRPALSHAVVLEQRAGAALVAVRIATGRAHQVRIHMAAAGHPLVGDPLYGPGGVPLVSASAAGRGAALPGDTGYWLHSWRLALAHPADGRRLQLECSPPPVLRAGGTLD